MDIIEKFLDIASSIYTLCEKVNTNESECQELANDVRGWEPHILKIKGKGAGNISEDVIKVISELTGILEKAADVVRKYSSDNLLKRAVKVNKHGGEIDALNKQLNKVFQRLSTALHLETQDKIEAISGNVSSGQDALDGRKDADKAISGNVPSGQDAVDGMTDADKVKFVNQHMAVLIQNVTQVKAITDKLHAIGKIHRETHALIDAQTTNMDKMRILYTNVLQGKKIQLEFYKLLKKLEPALVDMIVEGEFDD